MSSDHLLLRVLVQCVELPLRYAHKLGAFLDRAIGNMSAIITERSRDDIDEEENENEIESIPADPNVTENSYTLVDDDLYYRQNSRMYKCDFSKDKNGAAKAERIKAMLPVRDSLRRLIELQTNDYPDSEIQAEQEKLNRLYRSSILPI